MRQQRFLRWQAAAAVTGAVVLAACAGSDPTVPPPAVPGAIQVTGTDRLTFDPDQITTAAGEVTIQLTSERAVPHDFVIEELDDRVASAPAGRTDTGTVTLDAGTYTFFCSVPGHRAAGMEGVLNVTG